MMFLKLAWRNVFRNTRRTLIAGTAIGIGLASLIFVDAMIIGMKNHMIDAATASFMGQGQIHAEGYRSTREASNTINKTQEVLGNLAGDERVEHYTPRAVSFGMVSSAANMTQVALWGVQPHTEQEVSRIDDAIVEGGFFAGDSERDMVIGSELAELLEVEIGDRIVVTLAEAHSGALSQELFRVSGIYRFGAGELDKGMAFIRLDKAQSMLGIDRQVHEIAMTFPSDRIPQNEDHPLWEEYSHYGNEAVGWPILMPQFQAVLQMTDMSLAIMAVVLFSVVALGIINTLFMSLYERMFEFGVLLAVGTRRNAIWRMVVGEAGSLAVISCIVGTALGFVITLVVSKTGIDYRGIEFTGITIRELIYPVLTGWQFVTYPLFVLVFTVVVGMYPATYAARLTAADAMRRSL